MKTAILTYHFSDNYGAVLQAYALKKYIERNGNSAEILNYNTSSRYLKSRSTKARLLSFGWNGVKQFIGGGKKKKAFSKFRKKFLGITSDQIKKPEDLKNFLNDNKFDAFIVGSDQVWNPVLNGRDENYYLAFADKALRISYAASFGVSAVEEKDYDLIKDNVSAFDAISVREQTGCEILSVCGVHKPVSVVLDPVFLLSAQEWSKIASPRVVDEKYVLCYVMPGDKNVERKITSLAEQISKKNGYKVVYLGRKEYYRFKNDGKDMVGASPEDFLSLIKNAEAIVTNSFHGTAFSILFEKNFYSVKNAAISAEKQLSSRIHDLLALLGLRQNLVECASQSFEEKNIDYVAVTEKLEEKKKQSKDFLKYALGKDE